MPPLLKPHGTIVLASQSPQRKGLLRRLVPKEYIRVLPPRDSNEAGFDHLHTLDRITKRLQSIAGHKAEDVRARLGSIGDAFCIIAADTAIVVGSDKEGWQALGKPAKSHWQRETRRWFREYYAGKTHLAMTAVHVRAPGGVRECVVTTRVTFAKQVDDFLDAYIATWEPWGKAGGYAIQDLGSLFVDRIEGSATNVIGLPLRELAQMLREVGFVS